MNKIIKKEVFPVFIEYLFKNFEVFGPSKKESVFLYKKLTHSDELNLNKTQYPAKKCLFPTKDQILSFNNNRILESNKFKKRILILLACDANALLLTDKFLLSGVRDLNYAKNRSNSLVFVFNCLKPEESCFCTSFDTHLAKRYDLLFTDLGDCFFVEHGSKKGKEFLNDLLFIKTNRKRKSINLVCNHKVDVKGIKQPNARVWEKYAKECLGCSACIMVCPVCTCFEIFDELNLDLKSGSRFKSWMSCQQRSFRVKRSDRIKHRILHKFKYFKEAYGMPACVGCGRCIDACPAGISIPKILEELK